MRGLERLRQKRFCMSRARRADAAWTNAKIVVSGHLGLLGCGKLSGDSAFPNIARCARCGAMLGAWLKLLSSSSQPTARTLRALSCPPNRAGKITPSLAFQTSSAPCLGSSIASTVASVPSRFSGMRPFAVGAGLSHALHQVGKRDCSSRQRSHHDGIAKEHCCRHDLWTATLMLWAHHFLSAEYLQNGKICTDRAGRVVTAVEEPAAEVAKGLSRYRRRDDRSRRQAISHRWRTIWPFKFGVPRGN